jgi:uncharacterized protein (TIGR02597 family)
MVLALGAVPAEASGTVATVPDGMITLPIIHGVTNYLSIPLTNIPTYSSTVSSVTMNMITVDDAPAPFTSNLATSQAPYFVQFLSGNETGRILLVTANTGSSLTVDTTDHISGAAVALTATGFNVQVGDTFEIFPGDTLASIFGNGTPDTPLLLSGGPSVGVSDVVSLFTSTNAPVYTYYFNTTSRSWVMSGSTANANNTIIYPFSAFAVLRQASHPDITLTLGGHVAKVSPATKLVNQASVFTSSHLATDITLSQLHLGSNWVHGPTLATSDSISIWNTALNKFDVFYQVPNLTWRKYPDMTTDQSKYVIWAGSVAMIAKKANISGVTTFLQINLPYSLE